MFSRMKDEDAVKKRLAYLEPIEILYTLPEKEYDAITQLAAFICGTPISLITLLDDKNQFFKSHHGLNISEIPLEYSICNQAIQHSDQPFIVQDLHADERFKDNPLINQDPKISFYAGIPLITPSGTSLGTLCVMDHNPRSLSEAQIEALLKLRDQVITLLELRHLSFAGNKQIQELEAAKDRNRKLIENTDGIFWEADAQTFEFYYVSPQAEKFIGYTAEEWLNTPNFWQDHIHPDDRTYAINTCHTETTRLQDHTFDYRMRTKSGEYIWMQDKVKVYAKDGKPHRITGLLIDINASKKIEKALAASEKKFRAIVQDGGDMITILDTDGNFTYISSTAFNILGWVPDKMLGENCFDLIHPEDLTLVLEEFKQLQKSKRIELTPYRFKDNLGRWRWIETIATNFLDEEGIKGILTNSRDISKQQEFQQKLESSEARYRLFFESQSNYIIKTDLEGRYTYVNKKFIEEFGWIHNYNFEGRYSLESICDYHHEKVIEIVSKCMEEPGRVYKFEVDKPAKKAGEVVTTLWDFVCLTDEDGNPTEIQCSGININDRIKAERQVKEINERFELLNEASSEVIYESNPITGDFYLGRNFERIFGHLIDREKEVKDWYKELIHPDDKDFAVNSFNLALENPKTEKWSHIYRMRNKAGEYLWIEDSAVILRNKQGEPIRIIGTIKDITEIERIKELLDSASKLSKVGGWEINMIKNTLSWTPTTCDIFGVPHDYKPDVAKAINFYKEEFREEISSCVENAIEKNQSYEADSIIITMHGEEKWIKSIGQPEFVNGKCVRVYGSVQDIHDKKLSEQKLQQLNLELQKNIKGLALSNQELEQFAYIASHDLQEPLRMVSSFMRLLEKKYDQILDEKAKQYIHFAIDGANRMKQIILDLLEFSRVGRDNGNMEYIPVKSIIEKVLGLQSKRILELNAMFEIGDLPMIKSFETPIRQIFQNLIENSLKYTRKGVKPSIKIKAEELPNYWKFSVEDNGLGIQQEYFDKIFILFQRLHTKDEFSGTGIGLAIVKKNVDLLGGEIWVESEVDKGTTFFFTIKKQL
ncbi:PAS domain S-box-containing protein [Belliella buryatensis]|uniref:histidine kinase n=2 Tax=Belliella buryatensis TaxID=1500549 RepID=A0A239AQ48_9BACT|nr:PAS domain S-box-containing protein [Belliella buryatensis]